MYVVSSSWLLLAGIGLISWSVHHSHVFKRLVIPIILVTILYQCILQLGFWCVLPPLELNGIGDCNTLCLSLMPQFHFLLQEGLTMIVQVYLVVQFHFFFSKKALRTMIIYLHIHLIFHLSINFMSGQWKVISFFLVLCHLSYRAQVYPRITPTSLE